MKVRAFVFLTLLMCTSCVTLSGCFKEWTPEEVKEWYVKQPETWDEFMAAGNTADSNGKIDKAAERFQQALEMAESAYGPNDVRVATTCTALAALQARRFKWAEAEKLYEQALEIQEKSLPKGHAETTATRKALAEVKRQLFKPEEAAKLLTGIKATPVSKPSKRSHKH